MNISKAINKFFFKTVKGDPVPPIPYPTYVPEPLLQKEIEDLSHSTDGLWSIKITPQLREDLAKLHDIAKSFNPRIQSPNFLESGKLSKQWSIIAQDGVIMLGYRMKQSSAILATIDQNGAVMIYP